MEVKFRQKGIGWCTVYTWANLLSEPGVLRLTEDERYKGCTEKEENELLEMFMPSIRIKDVAYINPAFPYRLSAGVLWDILTLPDDQNIFEEQAIIHTLSVRVIESIWHHVGVVTYFGDVFYLDPMRESWLKLTDCKHLSEQFLDCCQISRPVHIETMSFASFDAKYFQYGFLNSQKAIS